MVIFGIIASSRFHFHLYPNYSDLKRVIFQFFPELNNRGSILYSLTKTEQAKVELFGHKEDHYRKASSLNA